jgi:hypothetical protein
MHMTMQAPQSRAVEDNLVEWSIPRFTSRTRLEFGCGEKPGKMQRMDGEFFGLKLREFDYSKDK